MLNAPADLVTAAHAANAPAGSWDTGLVRHMLPTVSDNRMLIKASFTAPLAEPPTLRVGPNSVRGVMSDTLVDFTPDKMVLRFFKWDIKTQPIEAIDTLEPFHVSEIKRPG